MKLTGLIVGIALQCMFAGFQFFFFTFGIPGQWPALAPWQERVVNQGYLVTIGTPLVVSLLLAVLYWQQSPLLSWWWHAVPAAVFLAYFTFFYAMFHA